MSQKLIPFEKEAVKAYLDRSIVYWRKRLISGDTIADAYVDVFQSVRMTLFGELLPLEGSLTPRATDVGTEWVCSKCGTTNMLDVPICQACFYPRR